jgi:hypothetical protein
MKEVCLIAQFYNKNLSNRKNLLYLLNVPDA